jgi:hypothetical protein
VLSRLLLLSLVFLLQLLAKVLHKVQRKYADATEQQVSALLQQLLQQNR